MSDRNAPPDPAVPTSTCKRMYRLRKRAQKRTVNNLTNRTQQLHQWSTMECCQPASWTTNLRLLVASYVVAYPERPTNISSTLPRVAHLDGIVIGCHQCITLHSESAPASPDIWPTPPGFVRYACHPSPPSLKPRNQPRPRTTTHMQQVWLTRPHFTCSHRSSGGHPQAFVVMQQQHPQPHIPQIASDDFCQTHDN